MSIEPFKQQLRKSKSRFRVSPYLAYATSGMWRWPISLISALAKSFGKVLDLALLPKGLDLLPDRVLVGWVSYLIITTMCEIQSRTRIENTLSRRMIQGRRRLLHRSFNKDIGNSPVRKPSNHMLAAYLLK